MNGLHIKNVNVITSEEIIFDTSVSIKDGLISAIGEGDAEGVEELDGQGCYLSPGFVDIHIHGGGGSDFMDGTVQAYKNAINTHLKYGTTSLVPTVLGGSYEEIIRCVRVYQQAKEDAETGDCLLGLHIEGPYISLSQAGAQPPQYIRTPRKEEYQAIYEESGGSIIRWSAAPEVGGMQEFSSFLTSKGITASIAHSNADYETVKCAYNQGFTLATHLYSAMSTITREKGFRKAGVLEAAYLIDDMNVEIIADGCHLPESLLQYVCKFKDKQNIALVTDAMRASGQDVKTSYLGTKEQGIPCIIEDGVAKLTDRSAFAGSVATADRLIRTMLKSTKISLIDAVNMLTINPLKFLNIRAKKGMVKKGYIADLVLFDSDINIKKVLLKGKTVYSV